LRDSLAKFRISGAYSMNSTTDYDFPPLRAFALSGDGRIAFNWPQYELTRSQDLPRLVHDAGAFYWLDTRRFLERQRLVGEDSICWQMERLRAVDIDTEEDFHVAEFLMRYHKEKNQDAAG
jgi:CMP-N-acetylneuraminic acid synthetase